MCGILGIHGNGNVIGEVAYGLTTIIHRGQDGTGIVTLDHTFHQKKKVGLASHIFTHEELAECTGSMGLGHTRYATQGKLTHGDAQPFTINHPYGIAMVHNGNITNFNELKALLAQKYHYLIESTNDIEYLLYTFAFELNELSKKTDKLTPEIIFKAVSRVQEIVQGAYASICLIANQGMLAFMDPHGIRPMLLGVRQTEQGISYAFASESKCFDYLEYDSIHQLRPGEAIFIDQNKKIHIKECLAKQKAFCVFEYIYLAQEDSVVFGRLVASEREQLGRTLAKSVRSAGLTPDIIIDVPSSGYFYAQGLAESLGVPYKRALVKNNLAKRSFITPTQELREIMVRHKLNVLKHVVLGKKVAVVDDSIVRGTTSKRIVRLLREAGAKEVYFISGSPPIKHPCVYGVDMSNKKEMIAADHSAHELAFIIGADAVIYPTLKDLKSVYPQGGICDACFSGNYPTTLHANTFLEIEAEKVLSCR